MKKSLLKKANEEFLRRFQAHERARAKEEEKELRRRQKAQSKLPKQ